MSQWLALCIGSVADQAGVEVEHIVQDAGSDDGTLQWLQKDARVRTFVEKDSGMYDAINRGLRRASGDILAHLNCDEQYLPGALHTVMKFFDDNPDIDVMFGDVLVVRPDGGLVCFQKVVHPTDWQIRLSHLPTYTAATFFRRRVIDKYRLFFRQDLTALADSYWGLDLLNSRIPFAVARQYLAVVTDTGHNLSLGEQAQRETVQLYHSAPRHARILRFAVRATHVTTKLLTGCYREGPLTYDIYTSTNPLSRTHFTSTRPTPFWSALSKRKNRDYYRARHD
ncbi:MAG: glycosyltransferase [Verrucomicrobia bacterium]|nr:glycosyltransferase [Verrucomicrobiota bacterium]